MFSEYASKFLQQSQTRMSAIRGGHLNPRSTAPLFHSAADFLPEDPEHEQEVQDLYALKSSRRHFGAYAPSSVGGGDEEEEEDEGDYSEESTQELRRSRGKTRGRWGGSGNIKSSWRASRSDMKGSAGSVFSDRTASTSKGKEKMVDIRLDQSERTDPGEFDRSTMLDSTGGFVYGYDRRKESMSDDEDDGQPPAEFTMQMPDDDESPPAFQQFERPPRDTSPSLLFASPTRDEEEAWEGSPFMPREVKRNGPSLRPGGQAARRVPQQVSAPPLEPPTHDHIWGSLYIFFMACLFTTSFIVWLHTEEPRKLRLADTIYNTLRGSMHLLTIDTFVAIAVALLWMYLLRSFVRPLIYTLLVAVPMVLIGLSIYPFVTSFKTGDRGYKAQDRAMRWGSIVPALMAASWVYAAWKGRNALHRAIGIIQLSCRILGDNPALVLLSFGTLIVTCLFTWVWVGLFARAFLTGNSFVGGTWYWTLSGKTAALGVYYIIMYLWTLGVTSGVHRATSAATVSQWYFHRHAVPTPSSKAVTMAALHHSTTTLFGTVCFHAFIALLVRLPLYIAPRRIVGIIHLLCFQFISSPVAALINPLTLTYAAIHSQPLIASSRAISNLKFVDTAGYGPNHHPRAAYRLSKMLLTAARAVTAMTLGIAAWIAAAKGSVYGYLVGLIAGSIGWAVLGTTEGCLSNVVDAALVCVGSEDDAGTHCREAQLVFGG